MTARNRFARSLAVFNISSYILGIGDRHPDNFLVDEQAGVVVGIGRKCLPLAESC